MIIKPTIEQLSQGKYNRYTLVQAAAKGARMITSDYEQQRTVAERMITNKETDKPMINLINREFCDEKAVSSSIKRLYSGEFVIKNAPSIDGTVD
ncbi:MAG: DNA-directed RNA polymerase subunit omega [Eubacteriales bacterium]